MTRILISVTAVALGLFSSSFASPARAQSAADLYQPLFSDFHTRTSDRDVTDVSAIQFGKVLTGGFGYNYRDGADDPSAAGLFFRPDLETEDEIVLGTSYVDLGSDSQFELQGKYTLENGLGFATGFFRPGISGQSEVFFARVNYELPFAGGKLSLSPIGQRQADRDYDVGAYAVYTNDTLLVGYGSDGEQARATVNYHFPQAIGALRPAAEFFFLDESVGEVPGNELVLATGTLSFSGGFLDQPYSVGRAQGPSNVTYNNPVSFTSLAFNRAYDVWEYGNFMNFRVFSVQAGDGRSTDYSTVVYPAQLLDNFEGRLERVFVGYKHVENDIGNDADAPILGYYGTFFGKFSGALSFSYDFQDEQGEFVFGLVYLH